MNVSSVHALACPHTNTWMDTPHTAETVTLSNSFTGPALGRQDSAPLCLGMCHVCYLFTPVTPA